MIGFVVTPEISAAVSEGVRMAFVSRDLPVTWMIYGMLILSGEHEGMHFLPAGDDVINMPIRPGETPQDFPEFAQLVGLLGGLESRVNIDPELVTPPSEL